MISQPNTSAPFRTALKLHLPPHLREVCTILAQGLQRMRAARLAHTAGQTREAGGESSLHFHPDQSGHANRTNRRDA